jgi:putative membrane-bound dehydrogenase-like protein
MFRTMIAFGSFLLTTTLSTVVAVEAVEIQLNGHRFILPSGFSIEVAASSPIVSRPICCDFDHRGRLYVAESSGSNDKVQVQLKERPHQILRLEDINGDGIYDRRTVFADQMMFPEGTLWHNGSLFVAAPPSIWKLTDTDDDGVADLREEWFDAKTLTGCANDLHGPYLGRDGWIYWCKGAFAEQTYGREDSDPWVTRAAHIFRRHPDGGPIEPVMTGGMDNPVEVVFMPAGERIFTTTFLQHPGGGRRDGLIHAVYGGIYGKRHGVLDGHPRTGELLQPMVHLGAAAPCGLLCRESLAWGSDYQYNLFACSFNMHKITRHQLTESGASFATQDDDFLLSDQLDFHPTDLIEDADGSFLVIDTGGWYKLCCPTSQLWKPDVLGAIYRVRKHDSKTLQDPWGHDVDWTSMSPKQLSKALADERPMVRRQAVQRLRLAGDAGVAAMHEDRNSSSADVRRRSVWTLGSVDSAEARASIREAVLDSDVGVRKAALSMVALWRDVEALPAVLQRVRKGSGHECRLAAEALGRIGMPSAVPSLLHAATLVGNDRFCEHSIIYALIEIGDSESTRLGLESSAAMTRRAAMIALDQMGDYQLQASAVLPLLDTESKPVREAAVWIADHQEHWGEAIGPFLKKQLTKTRFSPSEADLLQRFVVNYAKHPAVQRVAASALGGPGLPAARAELVLRAMTESQLRPTPPMWYVSVKSLLDEMNETTIETATLAAASFSGGSMPAGWHTSLQRIAAEDDLSIQLRLRAVAVLAKNEQAATDTSFRLACRHVIEGQPLELRSTAADIFQRGKFTDRQLESVCELIEEVGPLEVERVITAFRNTKQERVGTAAIKALANSTSAASIPPDHLHKLFAHFPATVREEAAELIEALAETKQEQLAGMETLLKELPSGDVRRGQKIFHGQKVACFACHAMGYLGGNIGPDLTRIGRIRSDRDLMEAILFPNLSFVRSYEPYQVITTDGKIYVGLLREDNALEIVLTTSDRKNVRILRDDIEEIQQSQVSIMPAGLDKQLSKQQLADLLEFLRSTR